MSVTAYVADVSDDELPPIPDRSIIDGYLKAGPRQGSAPREVNVGRYQYLMLDTHSGELRFCALPWHTTRNLNAPGNSFAGDSHAPMHWENVPDLIHWVIDSGYGPLPYLTADQGNALAHTVLGLAQILVDTLVPIADTDRRDWSRPAISASLDIQRAVQREPEPPLGPRPWLIEMAEAVEKCPEMVKPRWMDLTDKQLEEAADTVSRCAFSEQWYPQLLGLFDLQEHRYQAKVIGTRAWMAAHRAAAAVGYEQLDADRWFARPEHSDAAASLADATDEQLRTLADAAERAARLEGFRLLGTFWFLRTRRAHQRFQLVEELEELGTDLKKALGDYRLARLRLFGRFAQIVGWEDPAYENHSDLARRAGQPRQAVDRELKKLSDPDDDQAEDAA